MRFQRFVGLLFFFAIMSALMSASRGEIVYLKDGSALNGKLVKLVADTLTFRTSFGSEVRIPRTQVLRIDFVDSLALKSLSMTQNVATPQPPGSLMIHFDKVEVTSRINVHRNKERNEIERANTIHQILKIDGQVAHIYSDSVTDKVIREGPDAILMNDMKPQEFTIMLPAGPHRLELFIGNTDVGEYKGNFPKGGYQEYTLVVESIIVSPDETNVLLIRKKKKKLGLGKGQLVVAQ